MQIVFELEVRVETWLEKAGRVEVQRREEGGDPTGPGDRPKLIDELRGKVEEWVDRSNLSGLVHPGSDPVVARCAGATTVSAPR